MHTIHGMTLAHVIKHDRQGPHAENACKYQENQQVRSYNSAKRTKITHYALKRVHTPWQIRSARKSGTRSILIAQKSKPITRTTLKLRNAAIF